MGQRRLQFGFDLLGNKVYAFRGGTAVEDRLVTPLSKEEITDEFERAIAMYVGCGGDGTRLIQYEEAGELLTFEVQLKQVETTRRLRAKREGLYNPLDNRQGEVSMTLVFFMFGLFIVGFFLMQVLSA